MKAIVLEVKNGEAAVLCEDGTILKTKRTAPVGEIVELTAEVTRFPARRGRIMRTAVAAAIALAITGGTYTYTNVAAASYVTLDTEETSVELSVNRVGRVVGVRALDEDSAELAESLYADVRRMRVEDAVDAAMERIGDAQTVVAGVTGDTQRHTAALHEAVERGVGRTEREGVELVTLEVSREERREADEHDVSAGRWVFERRGGFETKDGTESNDADELTDASKDVSVIAPESVPEQAPDSASGEAPAKVPPTEPPTQAPAQSGKSEPAQPDGSTGGHPEPPDGAQPQTPSDGERQPMDTQPPQMQGGEQPDADDQMPPREPDGEQARNGELPQLPDGAMQPSDGGTQPPRSDGQQPFGNAPTPQEGGQQPPQGERDALGFAQEGGMQFPPGGMEGGPGGTPAGGFHR